MLTEGVSEETINEWLERSGIEPTESCVLARYPAGADSLAIVRVAASGNELVLKAGPRAIIDQEHEFVRRVHERLRPERDTPLFPRRVGYAAYDDYAVTIMTAASPRTLDGSAFRSHECRDLVPNVLAVLKPHLESLFDLYSVTLEETPSTMASYIYLGRFRAIADSEAFRLLASKYFPEGNILEERFGRDANVAEILDEMPQWQAALVPRWRSLVHGDVHLKNMLFNDAGSPVFIDPRIVWDGIRREDEGFGDPAYDLATLLHSVHPMSAILASIESGSTSTLSDVHLTSQMWSELVDHLTDRLSELDPFAPPDEVLRARLFVGAANALFGWLKYPNALPDRCSWIATFVGALDYLVAARTKLRAAVEQRADERGRT